MKLAKNVVVPFTRPSERRKKEELAFLPAALEIVVRMSRTLTLLKRKLSGSRVHG